MSKSETHGHHAASSLEFKRTELGLIPREWVIRPVRGDVTLLSGHHVLAQYCNTHGVGTPYLTGPADFPYGKIQQSKFTTRPTTLCEYGDILVTVKGSGAGTLVEANATYCISRQLMAIRPSSWNPKFLFYSLLQNAARIKAATTGLIPGLSRSDILDQLLPVPALSHEQHAIAQALSDVDGLIGALEKLIAKKRAIKEAAMQQLLTGKTRLPGFTGKWETKRIGDILTVRHGRSQHGVAVADGKHPILASGGEIGRTDMPLYEKPSVLIGRKGTIDAPQYIEVPFWTVDTLFYTEIAEPNSARFIFYRFCTIPWRNYNEASGVPSLNARTIENIEIMLPDSTEQTAIATVLSDMGAEIEALERRRDKTRQIKQGMMQQLLTGRIRLVKPGVASSEKVVEKTGFRKTNVYFTRSVLAAEIIDQLHEQPTFGHVKFEKIMFLVEHLCEVDTGSTYHRRAAGPYDNRALRSIDSQLRAQQWFDARKEGKRYQYVPMQKRGGHKRYFDRYFSGIGETFDRIIGTFKTLDTERCEIIATLLAAWSDLLRDNGTVSNELIVHEVLNNWHEAKRRIPEDRWLKALDWMRSRGFVPKGAA